LDARILFTVAVFSAPQDRCDGGLDIVEPRHVAVRLPGRRQRAFQIADQLVQRITPERHWTLR
jgi:hypothetical protein